MHIATLATLKLLLDTTNHLFKAGKIFINMVQITYLIKSFQIKFPLKIWKGINSH